MSDISKRLRAEAVKSENGLEPLISCNSGKAIAGAPYLQNVCE